MKKRYLLPLLCCSSMAFVLASCGEESSISTPVEEKFTISYHDGSEVIHIEEVKSGEKAIDWNPAETVKDKDFLGWYAEPTLKHEYDFDTAVTQDTHIFGAFVSYEKDERNWALAGSGLTSLLKESNWGKNYTEAHYMKNESIAKKNIYTMEMNLFVNDQFQFTDPVFNEENKTYSWGHQRGGAYLVNPTKDGKEYFKVGGGLGADNYTSNITAMVEGRYKFTLTTYPAGDFQKDDSPEVYNNRNYFDTLEWERVGDSTEVMAETQTMFFMKGAQITSWADLRNDHTLMVEESGIHTLQNVYLKSADEFMFASVIKTVETGEIAEGNEYIRATNLTEAGKTLVEGAANMKVKEDGYYTFTYDAEKKTLDVAKVTDYTPAVADYYVDGNFNGRNWGIDPNFKLVKDEANPEVYKLAAPITISAANQEIGIQYYNAELANKYVDYFGSDYVAVADDAYSLTKRNIVFNTVGDYNISLNTYSHIITITKA